MIDWDAFVKLGAEGGSYKLVLEDAKRAMDAADAALAAEIAERIEAGCKVFVAVDLSATLTDAVLEQTGFTIVVSPHVPEGQALIFDPRKLPPLDFPSWDDDIADHRSWPTA